MLLRRVRSPVLKAVLACRFEPLRRSTTGEAVVCVPAGDRGTALLFNRSPPGAVDWLRVNVIVVVFVNRLVIRVFRSRVSKNVE